MIEFTEILKKKKWITYSLTDNFKSRDASASKKVSPGANFAFFEYSRENCMAKSLGPRPFSGRLPSLHGINIMSCSFYTVNAICPKNKINKNAIMKWTQPSCPAPMCSYDFDQIKCKPMFETPKIFIDGPFKTSGLPTLRLRETPDAFETTILTLRTGHLFFVWQKTCFLYFIVGGKKLSERALRGLMHATAELKRRIKGWILEQGEIAFKVPKTAVRQRQLFFTIAKYKYT